MGFGVLKTVFKCAQVGDVPDKMITVRDASVAHNTVASGAKVRQPAMMVNGVIWTHSVVRRMSSCHGVVSLQHSTSQNLEEEHCRAANRSVHVAGRTESR